MTDDDSTPTAGFLRLDHFLKLTALSGTGGQAKAVIQNGEVKVNGETETRRRRKLVAGDIVEIGGQSFVVPQIPSAAAKRSDEE